jgi:hypothetical protein
LRRRDCGVAIPCATTARGPRLRVSSITRRAAKPRARQRHYLLRQSSAPSPLQYMEDCKKLRLV